MNKTFVEDHQVVQIIKPVDLAAGANTGDWVSLKDYNRCALIFSKEPGTAGDDPTLTLLQATAVAGTGSKALDIKRVDKKQAATDLTAVGTFTKSTSGSPATNDTFSTNTWTNSTLGEDAAVVVIDIKAEDLDIDNDFDCVSMTIADVGTAGQLGEVIAVLYDPKYAKETLDSAIAD